LLLRVVVNELVCLIPFHLVVTRINVHKQQSYKVSALPVRVPMGIAWGAL